MVCARMARFGWDLVHGCWDGTWKAGRLNRFAIGLPCGAGHAVLGDEVANVCSAMSRDGVSGIAMGNVCPSVECEVKQYSSTDIETPNCVS